MGYAATARSALASILREGTTSTLTRIPAAVRDPVAQSSTSSGSGVPLFDPGLFDAGLFADGLWDTGGDVPPTQSVALVIMPATETRDMTMDERVLVRKTQRHLIMAALKPDGSQLDWPIEDNQTITIDGATCRLSGVSEIAPDGSTVVLYEAEALR